MKPGIWWAAQHRRLLESRLGERLEKFEATLIAEFRKWELPESDPRIKAAALRTTDLELEALQDSVEKLEKGISLPVPQW